MNTKDTAYRIFNSLFLCSVQCMASMSDEELDEYGILYLNDPEYDNYIQNQWVTKYLNINQMVELHKRGVDIRVLKREDTKRIYEYIIDHLTAWKEVIENKLNIGGHVPYDDLIELDKFAARVYPYAKNYQTTRFIESLIAREVSGNSLIAIGDILQTRPGTQKDEHIIREEVDLNEEEIVDGYQSMTDLFTNKKATVNMSYTFKKLD